MKPGFEKRLAEQILEEQDIKTNFSKIPALAEHYNQRALIYDSDFDKTSLVLALSAGVLFLGSAFYFNQAIPLYLFAIILISIFIAAMSLRLQRENFFKSVNDPKNDFKDKLQMAAEHNVDYISNKNSGLYFTTFLTLTLTAVCAVVVSDLDSKWILYLTAPFIGGLVSLIIFYKNLKNLQTIRNSFKADIQKEIINLSKNGS